MKYRKIYYSIAFFFFSVLIIWGSVTASAEEVFLFSKPLSGVYLVKGDEERIIIYRQGPYIAPRLSPDGERILFHSRQGGQIGIWLTDLNGEEMKRICDGDQANWSPDGKRVIFRRGGIILERDIGSETERTITPEGWLSCEFPSYIPDGRALFVSNGKIFLASLNNKIPPEPLVEGDMRSAPSCSPDGKRIAYQDGPHIYLMNVDNKKIFQLTTAGGVQSWPVWSSDGLSVCYCQSPKAHEGPWDIYNVKFESPQEVNLVIRDVEISPDWRGSSPPVLNKVELKGKNISLWQIGESLEKKESWKALPMGDSYKLEGDIAVENDWIIFYLSSKENKFLIFNREMDFYKQGDMELSITNQKDKAASSIESIYVSESDGENVVLNVILRSEEDDITEVTFTVPQSRPFVGIEPVKNMSKVYIKRNTRLTLIPDRFADDLIFDPRKYSKSRILLPYTPILIGLPDDNSIFLVAALSDKQEMWLVKGEEEGFFAGVEALAEKEGIFVSPLFGRYLWYQPNTIHGSDVEGWIIDWSRPFLAQWRFAVAGKANSRMWDEEYLSRLTGTSLPVGGDFPENPELSIIYLYDRSWNTPLSILTPMDVLQDALGIEQLEDILDIEGIRAYHTAAKRIPLHDFLTSQENRLWPEDNPGWPQVLDFSPIFQLIVRIRMMDRKGVESTTTNLCMDILNSLKGLDSRIEEYEKFVVSLENLRAEQAASLFKIRESADNFFSLRLKTLTKNKTLDLRSKLADLSITGIKEVSDSIEAIESCSGTGDELWDRSEFYKFQEISESALSERQEVLTEYRNFVKQVRNNAGIAITEDPEIRDIAEEIRRITHNILRDRYYLEGDWRGEKPLE